ncbi:MAG: thioredoxin family protein [Bacteroidetes bacterium]|nr:thioredoxin family protein [Bacteroidota bacterium]
MVTKVTDVEFLSKLQEAPSVVVKFYADWCGSCRLFAPKFTKLSNKEEYAGISFLDVNAEENPEARKLAGVSNLPFFATFKNGVLVKADNTSKEESVELMIKELL